MHSYLIHEMFSLAAEKFYSRVAIDNAVKRATYADLEAQSNRLANFLIDTGAVKGSMVAIVSADAINVITAMIATLKAGCVFIPLDPALPQNRLESMISQVRPEWCIMESEFFDKVASVARACDLQVKAICLDKPAALTTDKGLQHLSEFADYSNTDKPKVISGPDDMCYIYFTSGSTGKPKAIAGRLKSLAHFIDWEIRQFDINKDSRVSQLTTPSFDAFLRDAFAPLCAGGTVCAPSARETVMIPTNLIDWVDIEQITVLHCVPSVFRSMLTVDLRPDYFSALRYVLMAGESLFPSDVKKWIEVFGDRIQLVNFYGPTETTLIKMFYLVKQEDKERRSIPIGKPMEGAAAIVIDAQGRPCPPGVVGEIYIRTPYRTLGYYNQPELTNEVFIQNPFGKDPDDLIYKTGDLGRVQEDGNFEYLGRKDQQVKIRGVRVEITEIEDLLRRHPAIKDVVVVARVDTS
ncbi:MAG: amino acid adenylation domain-containing protein, partial [Blastocatellia bacterium]